MSIHVKVCRNDKVRCVAIGKNGPGGAAPTLSELHAATKNAYPGLKEKSKNFHLMWKDCDGDLVTIGCDQELWDALESMSQEQPEITPTFSISVIKNHHEKEKGKGKAVVPQLHSPRPSSPSSQAVAASVPPIQDLLRVEVVRRGQVKGQHAAADVEGWGKVREVTIPALDSLSAASHPGMDGRDLFVALRSATLRVYPGLQRKVEKGKLQFALLWCDEEGEWVTLRSDAELRAALACMQQHGLPLSFRVSEDFKLKEEGGVDKNNNVDKKKMKRRTTTSVESSSSEETSDGEVSNNEGSANDSSDSDGVVVHSPLAFPASVAAPAAPTLAFGGTEPGHIGGSQQRQLRTVSLHRPTNGKIKTVAAPSNYAALIASARKAFPGLRGGGKCEMSLVVQWRDDEGDLITISSDAELQEALRCMTISFSSFPVSSSAAAGASENLPAVFEVEAVRKLEKMQLRRAQSTAQPPRNRLHAHQHHQHYQQQQDSFMAVKVCRDAKEGDKKKEGKVREVTIPALDSLSAASHPGMDGRDLFVALRSATLRVYPGLQRKVEKGKLQFALLWCDEEGEWVTLRSDAELRAALACMQQHGLPLSFRVSEDVKLKDKGKERDAVGKLPTAAVVTATSAVNAATITVTPGAVIAIARRKTGNIQQVRLPVPLPQSGSSSRPMGSEGVSEAVFDLFRLRAQEAFVGLRDIRRPVGLFWRPGAPIDSESAVGEGAGARAGASMDLTSDLLPVRNLAELEHALACQMAAGVVPPVLEIEILPRSEAEQATAHEQKKEEKRQMKQQQQQQQQEDRKAQKELQRAENRAAKQAAKAAKQEEQEQKKQARKEAKKEERCRLQLLQKQKDQQQHQRGRDEVASSGESSSAEEWIDVSTSVRAPLLAPAPAPAPSRAPTAASTAGVATAAATAGVATAGVATAAATAAATAGAVLAQVLQVTLTRRSKAKPISLDFTAPAAEAGLGQGHASFAQLVQRAVAVYPGLRGKPVAVQWTDDDGDIVRAASDAELLEALHCMLEHGLPLQFRVEVDKHNSP